jgi:hypothetical protein
MRHGKHYEQRHLALHFLQGLADKTCAVVVCRQLHPLKLYEVDIQHVQATVHH